MIENQFGGNIEEAIEREGEIVVCSSGTSMYPMLRNRRDMVVVEKLDRPLKKSDVPVYRMPTGKIIMHRILKVRDNDYVIRGDNTYILEYIRKEWIIGVLKAFYRNGKYCDCATSKGYRVYIFLNKLSYPLRYLWIKIIRPTLVKVKRFILSKLKA